MGLYEKQSSFYMQAKTALTNITGNVMFNGPRAGINFNDGLVLGGLRKNVYSRSLTIHTALAVATTCRTT